MRSLLVIVSLAWLDLFGGVAAARVDIAVDLARQEMQVDGAEGSFTWPISSGRFGHDTPRGSYRVKRLELMHRSHRYDNAPMPHAMFFSGGYAIHGTYAEGALGRPASHGCIRLSRADAATLYGMVQREGGRVTIVGASPVEARRLARRTAVARDDDLPVWGSDAPVFDPSSEAPSPYAHVIRRRWWLEDGMDE